MHTELAELLSLKFYTFKLKVIFEIVSFHTCCVRIFKST